MIRLRLYIKKLFPPIAIAISICITLLSAYRQPLWLDEQYSLFFAKAFSPIGLLWQFSADIHPGLYYLSLKPLLLFTQNLFALRILSSILPAYMGLASLIWFSKTEKNRKFLWYVAPLLFLNPLLINVISQLRMYGLITLFTCLIYICHERIQKDFKFKYLWFLSLLLILSAQIDYSLLWFAFIVVIKLLFDRRKSIRIWGSGLTLLLVTQNILNHGLANKEQLSLVGWISTPNSASISSVFSTVLGLSNDYFANHTRTRLIDLIFDAVLFITFLFGFRFFLKNRNDLPDKPVLINFVLFSLSPVFFILIASLLLPFVSKLPVFYHFVPNISLFIPRIQLGFAFIGILFLTDFFVKRKKIDFLFYAYLVITPLWIVNGYRFNLLRSFEIPSSQIEVKETLSQDKETVLSPSWLYIESIQLDKLQEISVISSQMKYSKQMEKSLNDTSKICALVKGKKVSSKEYITENLISQTKLINDQLSSCCKRLKQQNGFAHWSCGL